MPNLTIHKQYLVNLPKQQLFEAWISSDIAITPVTKIEVDPKIGGFLRLIVESPEGSSIMHGEFLTFSRPHQLDYSWQWDGNGEVTRVTVDFKEKAGGTEIRLIHAGFQSEKSRAMHDSGWDSYVNGVIQKLTTVTSQ